MVGNRIAEGPDATRLVWTLFVERPQEEGSGPVLGDGKELDVSFGPLPPDGEVTRISGPGTTPL